MEQVLKMQDPDGYRVFLHESLRLPDEEVIALYRKGPDLLEGAILGLEEEELDLKTPGGRVPSATGPANRRLRFGNDAKGQMGHG